MTSPAIKASTGRIVHLIGPDSNGTDVAPAIITRAWSDVLVNLTAFPDCGAPKVATSISLFVSEAEAREWLAAEEYRSTAAFWPPRV